jgi:DeoR/GlpR family transcriptional regulator of sugar metabolism
MADETPINGYIRWRDLTETEKQLRRERQAELAKLETSTRERFERAHAFYSEAVTDQATLIARLIERLDRVESMLDKQSGAWMTIRFLIGSNVALTVVGVLSLLVFFR